VREGINYQQVEGEEEGIVELTSIGFIPNLKTARLSYPILSYPMIHFFHHYPQDAPTG
jgi:hypothetical protein